jgi:MoaA/NifB/PqqE/SkfB family radical SAM enzyme
MTKGRGLHFIALSIRIALQLTFFQAGGEPTLHPQLSEVISYISRKGINAEILSNGYGLTDEMLKMYRKSGVKEILIHIDIEQVLSTFKSGYVLGIKYN